MEQNKNNTVKRVIQVILVILLLIGIWYIGKDWLRPRIIKALGGYTAMEQKLTIDTLEVKYDSLYYNQDSLKSLVFILNQSEQQKNVRIKYYQELLASSKRSKNDKVITKDGVDYIEKDTVIAIADVFDNEITDTLITGNIKTVLDFKNQKILSQSLQYKPKFPILVTKTITVEKVVENTLSDKKKAYFGLGVNGTTDNTAGIKILYQTPSLWQFEAGVNKYLTPMSPSSENKGNIQIGITKLF